MARARAFRTQALARIWEELRFAPPATLARLVADAEAFAATVDPMLAYPEALVLERITRYRSDAAGVGDVIVGQALLADLATFVERATARAPLAPEARGGAVTLADAAAKLGVSRSSIDRYRARGLMCHHVRIGETVELRVFAHCLRDFVAAHVDLVQRAASTGRLTKEARAALAVSAMQRLAAGPATIQALAEQLAPSLGRSVRTVRRALEDDARVAEGAARTAARTLDDAAARHAARAWQLGVSPQQMSERGMASVAACTRAVQRGRALILREAASCAHPLVLPNFQRADSAVTLLAPPAVRSDLPAGDWAVPAPRLSSTRRGGVHGAELAQVVAHHFLLWRAVGVVRSSKRPDSAMLDAAERDLRWAYRLRRAVVQAALPDGLARVAQHLGSPWSKLPPDLQVRWAAAVARAAATALEFRALSSVSIDEVHPLRAASMAVERMLTSPDLNAHIAHTPSALHAAVIAPWLAHLDSGDRWTAVLDAGTPVLAAFVARRFGLDGKPPSTMEELARLVPGSAAAAQARLYAALLECRNSARISAC
jgi:hypothetical protein